MGITPGGNSRMETYGYVSITRQVSINVLSREIFQSDELTMFYTVLEILNIIVGWIYTKHTYIFQSTKKVPKSKGYRYSSIHRGMYKMHRLSFEIKTAPSEFNWMMYWILLGLQKTEAYFGDIIVHRATKEECSANLHAYLQRFQELDLHLNRKKCLFFEKSWISRTHYST